jgi:hypothetical protein
MSRKVKPITPGSRLTGQNLSGFVRDVQPWSIHAQVGMLFLDIDVDSPLGPSSECVMATAGNRPKCGMQRSLSYNA